MEILIQIKDGGEKKIMGNYHVLHNIDWNEKIRLMLDEAKKHQEDEHNS